MKTEVIAIAIAVLIGISLAAGYGVGDATHQHRNTDLDSYSNHDLDSNRRWPYLDLYHRVDPHDHYGTDVDRHEYGHDDSDHTEQLHIFPRPKRLPQLNPMDPTPSNETITSIAVSGDGQYVAVGAGGSRD